MTQRNWPVFSSTYITSNFPEKQKHVHETQLLKHLHFPLLHPNHWYPQSKDFNDPITFPCLRCTIVSSICGKTQGRPHFSHPARILSRTSGIRLLLLAWIVRLCKFSAMPSTDSAIAVFWHCRRTVYRCVTCTHRSDWSCGFTRLLWKGYCYSNDVRQVVLNWIIQGVPF